MGRKRRKKRRERRKRGQKSNLEEKGEEEEEEGRKVNRLTVQKQNGKLLQKKGKTLKMNVEKKNPEKREGKKNG